MYYKHLQEKVIYILEKVRQKVTWKTTLSNQKDQNWRKSNRMTSLIWGVNDKNRLYDTNGSCERADITRIMLNLYCDKRETTKKLLKEEEITSNTHGPS